jgi:hypothetical protein
MCNENYGKSVKIKFCLWIRATQNKNQTLLIKKSFYPADYYAYIRITATLDEIHANFSYELLANEWIFVLPSLLNQKTKP